MYLTTDFEATANLLLNDVLLRVKGKHFRILEIEFYDDDIYCHRSSEQYQSHVFYFHPTGGTRKGFGLSFYKEMGSVLLRSFQDIETDEIIDGPSLLVDRLLLIYPDCRSLNGKDIFSFEMRLIEKKLTRKEIYQTVRFGLSLKFDEEKKIMKEIKRLLRYLTNPSSKKGRIQTLYSLKERDVSEIQNLMKVSKSWIQKYLEVFENSTLPSQLKTVADLANLLGSL